MIILHVAVALSSLIFASYLLMKPSQAKFYINYGFITAVIATGTYLIVATGVNILHTCVTGLCYLTVVAGLTALAGRRLAHERVSN